ncbi:uracil-DNA glycosylase [Blochmannia endosymbiont of Polyrhachis (Hedomyrma) turneri]|uniref:uracil-DNA glycosylase n=1 Tax=Blochmannia endosymbiont of Polyrhachis (Hedomyrma) turneri TaxID=1505596 RepID=UPI00061A59DB|nr:uracil-DNA glycosylase [Blochmannia endosymbiont of Polyrhachis (Hedomyrma) turneri]AKC60104.1 uracil-DNA glycosylase [Blochmannia endosymbiont of Polyrhachis (Hedomyrma) turneri]
MKLLTWKSVLSSEKSKLYFKNIFNYINQRKSQGIIIYPEQRYIFHALKLTPFQKVKVVIIGQDPYHQPNQAHGLAFSVQPGITIPPSLMNIYKELSSDISTFVIPKHGCLESWAKEGVLLLNSILTVEAGKTCSHANIGWEQFTDKIIDVLNTKKNKLIFLLWGKYAQKKGNIINNKNHYILKTSHPSPLSAQFSFFGCKHFSKTNYLLTINNQNKINWQPRLL